MSTFKITNITNTIGKREAKYNSILNIEYVDKMTKKTIPIKAGDTIYLTLDKLPISAHLLRVKNLVTISEVSADELTYVRKIQEPKKVVMPTPTKETNVTGEEPKSQKKPVIKKEKEEV